MAHAPKMRELFGPDLTFGEISAMMRELERFLAGAKLPTSIQEDFEQLLNAAAIRADQLPKMDLERAQRMPTGA